MKESIQYEIKRILLPLCIFAAITTALFAVTALSSDFILTQGFPEQSGTITSLYPGNPLGFVPAVTLCFLCYIVPCIQFSYRMKPRSVDLWYSLPVKRDTLLLVRTIGGLMLVFIPYAISYTVGVTIIACSENIFHMSIYAALFFASLPAGILLFGINSFLFSRANSVGDGIIFMLAGTFLLTQPALYLKTYVSDLPREALNSAQFTTFGPTEVIFQFFNAAICYRTSQQPYAWIPLTLTAIEGIAAWFGLFYTAKSHRAESAGQISDSWFGLKFMIPYYLFFAAACTPAKNVYNLEWQIPFVEYTLMIVLAVIAYFVYRRSFRLKRFDLYSLGASFSGGLILMLISVSLFFR